jgi:hypothetical protein
MNRIIFYCAFAITILACADNNLDELSTCSTPATIKDLTGLDGCGFVFELEDGTRLEPVKIFMCGTPPITKDNTDPLHNFELVDGKKVFIDYEAIQGASICMAGQTVRITCISEAVSTQSDR